MLTPFVLGGTSEVVQGRWLRKNEQEWVKVRHTGWPLPGGGPEAPSVAGGRRLGGQQDVLCLSSLHARLAGPG